MKSIKKLNNGEHITIHLFGKEKDIEIFSTGDNQFDDSGNDKPAGFALSEEEIACLNWFIEHVKSKITDKRLLNIAMSDMTKWVKNLLKRQT